jgi:ribonucleoside-diphosphate reductase alpha chain
MQFAGAAIEQHNARMFNCSYTLIDREEVFDQIFYLLLCGCGVGYSIQWHHVEKLHKIQEIRKYDVRHCVIDDSILGWAHAVGALMNSFFRTGEWVEFAYNNIRRAGNPLITSGGVAPGHLPLKKCLEKVRYVCLRAQGRKLRPIECHDIICHLADAVLAGGIRRASLIALFSPEDTEMMYAKSSGCFDPVAGLNSQRALANNSAILVHNKTDQATFNRIIDLAQQQYGEPGFFFSEHENAGCNPCGEIGLMPVINDGTISGNYATGFAFCNLCEINVACCKNYIDLIRAAKAAAVIGTLQATYDHMPYFGPTTKLIAERDRLLGVSMTGIMDNPELMTAGVLQKAAMTVKGTNIEIATALGINIAARCTTVKPSGTASLELGGVGAGIHPHHARRYFRRVTANPLETVAQEFKHVNPHMVEQKPNGDWALVFPVEVPEGAIVRSDMSAEKMLDWVTLFYMNWIQPGCQRGYINHNVSCTLTVKDVELEDIKVGIWRLRHKIGALAIANDNVDVIYPFAPREEVRDVAGEARWNNMVRLCKRIDWLLFNESSDTTSLRQTAACDSEKCELGISQEKFH